MIYKEYGNLESSHYTQNNLNKLLNRNEISSLGVRQWYRDTGNIIKSAKRSIKNQKDPVKMKVMENYCNSFDLNLSISEDEINDQYMRDMDYEPIISILETGINKGLVNFIEETVDHSSE